MIIVGFVLIVLSLIGIVFILIWDHNDLTRLYAEMDAMTPRDAYRRSLVLKYLPQCQQDMDEIIEMVNQRYGKE